MAKRRANGQGTIRKRANGTWEAVISLGGKRKSLYGKTQAEVRKKMTALQAEYDSGEYQEPSTITIAEWAKTWLEDYTTGKRDSTIAQYRMYINRRILPTLGSIQLSKLTTPKIQHLYNELMKEVEAKTVKNIHGILHSMLDKAVKIGYIRFNPSEACELPKATQKEMQPILDDNLPRFLGEIASHKYGDLYFLATFTGMRESEIIGLTWDCIDFERGTIRLYRQLYKPHATNAVYQFCPLKTRRERVFKPAPQVMDKLKHAKAQQAQWQLKAGEAWSNPDDLVFTNEIGEHLCAVTVYNNFKRIVKSIGMPDVRFHDLRHTFCTLAVESGTDMKTISDTVGHATVAFTQDKYGHVSDKMMDNASANMERLIKGL